MKIRPLSDRVLVKRIEEDEKTKGGIIIPDTAREKPTEAKVIAVGKGKVGDDGKLQTPVIKAGDRVLLSKWGGRPLPSLPGRRLSISQSVGIASP